MLGWDEVWAFAGDFLWAVLVAGLFYAILEMMVFIAELLAGTQV